MLSQIRHFQKGLLIALTIVIVVAFAFLYSDYDFVGGTLGPEKCRVKVYDRCYRLKEARKLASHFDLSLELGLYDFAMFLFGERRMDRDRTDFVVNLIVLRREAEKLGIEPSADEIKAAIPQLPIFQQPWVNAQYLENNVLGPNGFTQADLAQLVKDYLSFQKMRDLVSAGVEAPASEAEKRYIRRNQRFHASVIRFDRAKFAENLEITDKEVADYYEENKDALLSEAKRGFHYVKFTPKALPDESSNEEKTKARASFANAVNRAYADLVEDGEKFLGVAASYVGEKAEFNAESGTLEAFARPAPPELLQGNEAVLEELFSETLQPGGVTVPLEAGEGGYLVFHFAEAIDPQPLSLEEATPAIKEAILVKKSNSAANNAASEALAKLNEAVKAGKAFAAAAKELGYEAAELPSFSMSEPPANLEEAAIVLQATEGLSEKQISAVTERPGGEGYLLVYVDKIELYKDEQAESSRNALLASIKAQTGRTLFQAWFNQKRAASGAMRSTSVESPSLEP